MYERGAQWESGNGEEGGGGSAYKTLKKRRGTITRETQENVKKKHQQNRKMETGKGEGEHIEHKI